MRDFVFFRLKIALRPDFNYNSTAETADIFRLKKTRLTIFFLRSAPKKNARLRFLREKILARLKRNTV